MFHVGAGSMPSVQNSQQTTFQGGSQGAQYQTGQSHDSNTHQASTTSTQVTLSDAQLLAMASNKYADGNLPLGDKKYVTENPQKGYVYLCNANTNSGIGGAQTQGPWIHGTYWNINQKISVQGKVSWPNAQFSNSVANGSRTLSGNDLPSHTTGTFPIASTDPAYAYDRNPNSIKVQSFTDTFPLTPTYADQPYCMGGEAGIMLTGVALFNAFDAQLRDAVANEVQDSCQGHPEVTGEYHYHGLSSCIKDISETTIIGYALDGFPITGPKVATNKYLTTENLDECHGITSLINVDGTWTTTYHYVMTEDFPYSVSCFRGKPVSLQVLQNSGRGGGQQQGSGQQGSGLMQQGQMQRSNNTTRPQPPQAAITACSSSSVGISCSFTGPNGTIIGTCQTPPGQSSLICVPSNMLQGQTGQSQSPQ